MAKGILDLVQFDNIIKYWNSNPSYKTEKKGKTNIAYRKIFMEEWHNENIHYEFKTRESKPNIIGVEFHNESNEKGYEKINESIRQFCGKSIFDVKIRYEINEGKYANHGTLKMDIPKSHDEATICKYMAELITLTKTAITQALKGA